MLPHDPFHGTPVRCGAVVGLCHEGKDPFADGVHLFQMGMPGQDELVDAKLVVLARAAPRPPRWLPTRAVPAPGRTSPTPPTDSGSPRGPHGCRRGATAYAADRPTRSSRSAGPRRSAPRPSCRAGAPPRPRPHFGLPRDHVETHAEADGPALGVGLHPDPLYAFRPSPVVHPRR